MRSSDVRRLILACGHQLRSDLAITYPGFCQISPTPGHIWPTSARWPKPGDILRGAGRIRSKSGHSGSLRLAARPQGSCPIWVGPPHCRFRHFSQICGHSHYILWISTHRGRFGLGPAHFRHVGRTPGDVHPRTADMGQTLAASTRFWVGVCANSGRDIPHLPDTGPISATLWPRPVEFVGFRANCVPASKSAQLPRFGQESA